MPHEILAFGFPELVVVVGVVALGLVLVWLCEYSALAPFLQSCQGVVPPFANIPALTFALFFAYLITGVTHDRVAARESVATEAMAVRWLWNLQPHLGESGGEFRSKVADYARLSTADGWRSDAGYLEASASLARLQYDVTHGLIPAADSELRGMVSERLNDILEARRHRFVLSNAMPQKRKWLAALLLGILTQVAVAATHLGKPRASMLAVMIFSVALGLALSAMVSLLDPFQGGSAADVRSIKAVLESPRL